MSESGLNEDLLHAGHVCRIVGEVTVLVFNLCRDHGSAIADLIFPDLLAQALHPSLNRNQKCGIVCAKSLRHPRIFQKPCWKAAELPFRARVWARSQEDVKMFILSKFQKSGEIGVAGEVVNTGSRFMNVPEHVGGNGVQSHRLSHLHALAPIFVRYTCVMDLAGYDLERLMIQLEVVPCDLKRMLSSLRNCVDRQHLE